MNDSILRQSTATTVVLGPFVDDADGKTAETALTISQADVRLSKNAGTFAQKNDATAATHMELGYYACPLSTTDTNTLGRLTVVVHESGALPRRKDFLVVTANVWDTLCSTDRLDVEVAAMAANTITSTAIQDGAIAAGKLGDDAMHVGVFADGAITAASIATGAMATLADVSSFQKNVAVTGFPFFMVATDGTAATGKTITATRSIDGAALASCANSATEISGGWYKIDLATTDMNGESIALNFAASGCRTCAIVIKTQG